MARKTLLILALGCLCLHPVSAGEQKARDQRAAEVFAGAFRKWLTPEQRIALISNVARDHGDSRWADDALWVLARVATLRGDTARSILLRQQLLSREETVSLEKFTRSRRIYRRSRLPEVEYLLEQTGHLYSGGPGHTRRFNPIRMVLHEELARAYNRLDMARSAAREYRLAGQLAPPEGILAPIYHRRASRLAEEAGIGGDARDEKAHPLTDTTSPDHSAPSVATGNHGE